MLLLEQIDSPTVSELPVIITLPLPSIMDPASSVRAGNEDVRVIVAGEPGGKTVESKSIVSAPGPALLIAWRRDPGPESLVVVTIIVAAKAVSKDICRIRIFRNNTNDKIINLFKFILLPSD
jgi:hypothetical protein